MKLRTQPAKLEAVIFDLDGLLVDSEPLQFMAYRDAFAEFGLELTQPEWRLWHELGASASAWVEYRRWQVDPEAVRAAKKVRYEALIESDLRLKAGARGLVEELADAGIRLCVASSSRPESIAACLERFGLAAHFERQFSVTQTARKKPHPDVFDLALNEMRVSAAKAVAIEDSPVGLEAALAAGLPCVVCADGFIERTPAEYQGAALLVSSLAELGVDVLEQQVRGRDTSEGER